MMPTACRRPLGTLARLGALLVAATCLGAQAAGIPGLEGAAGRFAMRAHAGRLPAVAFRDAAGRRDLSGFRGRLVVLNLWATWCPPCVKEMPALDRLQRAMRGDPVEVAAICAGCVSAEEVRAFYAEHGIGDLAVYFDPDFAVPPALAVRGLPTTLVLDGSGRELGRLEGDAEWDGEAALALIRFFLERGDADDG